MALNLNYMVRETGTNLKRNPTLTLASVVTIGVSLFLVGASLLLADGAKNATRRFQGGVSLVVFLDPQISNAQRDSVGAFIDANPLVKRKSYVDNKAAYKDFKRYFKDQPDVISVMRPQDVPTSFNVVPRDATVDSVEQLQNLLSKRVGVYRVAAATDAVRKIQRLSTLLTTGLALTAVCLLGAAVLLIVNTIRMAALARRREIEVMKLVGATNWFIRIPFMLEGLAQGMVGAGLAAAGVFGLNKLFEDRLRSTSTRGVSLLQSFVVDQSHVVATSTLLLVIGVVIGVAGSGFAVGRFIDV
ncbi:MAG: ABC transporter permease [Actinomycetota bacterium]|nr:ABC transporter permease [Actinomycetota bacterium]